MRIIFCNFLLILTLSPSTPLWAAERGRFTPPATNLTLTDYYNQGGVESVIGFLGAIYSANPGAVSGVLNSFIQGPRGLEFLKDLSVENQERIASLLPNSEAHDFLSRCIVASPDVNEFWKRLALEVSLLNSSPLGAVKKVFGTTKDVSNLITQRVQEYALKNQAIREFSEDQRKMALAKASLELGGLYFLPWFRTIYMIKLGVDLTKSISKAGDHVGGLKDVMEKYKINPIIQAAIIDRLIASENKARESWGSLTRGCNAALSKFKNRKNS